MLVSFVRLPGLCNVFHSAFARHQALKWAWGRGGCCGAMTRASEVTPWDLVIFLFLLKVIMKIGCLQSSASAVAGFLCRISFSFLSLEKMLGARLSLMSSGTQFC